MARIEYKYLISKTVVEYFREKISHYVELDRYSAIQPNHSYTVHSIYYDTPHLDFYYEKLAGIKRRKKLRIRTYNEYAKDSYVFLEIKRKNGAAISKTRAKVNYKDLALLMSSGDIKSYVPKNGGYNSIENAQKFLYHVHKRNLKPIVLISYEREAYFYKFYHGWRMTIDQNLRSCMAGSSQSLYNGKDTVKSLPRHYILEIKGTGGMPGWLRYFIGTLNLKLAALSKYTICIDSIVKIRRTKLNYSNINLNNGIFTNVTMNNKF